MFISISYARFSAAMPPLALARQEVGLLGPTLLGRLHEERVCVSVLRLAADLPKQVRVFGWHTDMRLELEDVQDCVDQRRWDIHINNLVVLSHYRYISCEGSDGNTILVT